MNKINNLECYAVVENPPLLRPARRERKWMDETSDKYAYRCLPLTIANSYGWELLCPFDIDINWDGGSGKANIKITAPDGENAHDLALSHFMHGIVTFQVGYLFRTDPGWDLMASGPFNAPKDGLAPLTGIIETDWAVSSFTMNWQITRPGMFSFKKDEPFCLLLPIPHNYLSDVTPKIKSINDNMMLKSQYEAWRASRGEFIAKLHTHDEEAVTQKWQKDYFKGADVGKLRMNKPIDDRKCPV